jgi:hypothetical protein
LPQETLAQLTGLTRQRVNQIFKTWELNGVIEQSYGRIVMIDRAKLEEIAQPCMQWVSVLTGYARNQ